MMQDNFLLRAIAIGNHFMIFVSSAVVTGIVSYFFNNYNITGAHIYYEEIIATMTLAVYTISMVLPLFNAYKGYMLPFNAIMSYLWLTSFIFSAQDWTGGRCSQNGPTSGKCSLKQTVVAFNFLAFFFLLCNIATETLLWRATLTPKPKGVTKEAPVSSTTDTAV